MKCLYVPKKVSSCLDDIRQRAGFHLTKKYQTIQKQASHSGAKKASSCLDEVRQQTGILLLFFSPSHKTQYMSITKFRRQCIIRCLHIPRKASSCLDEVKQQTEGWCSTAECNLTLSSLPTRSKPSKD